MLTQGVLYNLVAYCVYQVMLVTMSHLWLIWSVRIDDVYKGHGSKTYDWSKQNELPSYSLQLAVLNTNDT
jgi:hypothetical protein